MFSGIKMEEYMESELSGILQVKLVTKYSVWVPRDPIYAYEGSMRDEITLFLRRQHSEI